MEKITKLHLGLLAMGVILLITSSPVAASQLLPPPSVTTSDALSTDISLEYIDVAAGLDTAAAVSVIIFGGSASYPSGVDPAADGFSQARSWVVYAVDQADYATYLNRAPVQAPNNLTLMLNYPTSMSLSAAFAKAELAKGAVESAYGTTLYLTLISTNGEKRFVYTGGDGLVSAVASDVEGFSSGGFDDFLTEATITAAPVKAVGYGKVSLGGFELAFHGAIWVDADAISVSGADMTLSTQNIFGSDVNADMSIYGLSRIRFNIPYPIKPSVITPETSNSLPHVTGQMVWDLRHPVSAYELGNDPTDYKVVYQVGMDRNFPMVENKLTVDQAKLNQNGTLEFNYDLTNIGQADAKNIQLSFPVGPDFVDIVQKNITMYRLKDNVTLDESVSMGYNISLAYDLSGVPSSLQSQVSASLPELNYEFLAIDGWYVDSNGQLLFMDPTTEVVLVDTTISVTVLTTSYNVGVKLLVSSPDGMPTMAVGALNDIIVPALADIDYSQGISALGEVGTRVKQNMGDVLKYIFNETRTSAYDAVQIFKFNNGDFTPVKRVVGTDEVTAHDEWFLEANVSSLAPGATTTLKWWVDNVPKETDTFQTINFVKGETPDGYKKVTLQSKVQSYADVMRYILAVFDYPARPLSFYTGDSGSMLMGLDLGSPMFASIGMGFTWEDANGFKFFGLSNGQNLQIADNEAVLSTTVRFANNQQVFTVGDNVTIDVSVENSGDSDATDVKVHLVHAALGRNWQFDRMDIFHTENLGTVAAGDTVTFSTTVEANSFVGYHPVFAIVQFTSDAGEGPAPVTDFFDLGVTEWRWAGETKLFSTSTLTGGLLLPKSEEAKPAVPEPRIDFSSAIAVSATGMNYTLTATNSGDDDTTVTIIQTYNADEVELLAASSTKGVVETTVEGSVGVVTVTNVHLNPGESVDITMEFKWIADSTYLPPAAAIFTIAGQSSLGDHATTGTESSSGGGSGGPPSPFALDASASAQEQSQASATESGEYTAYSGGAAVGAAAGDVGGNQNTVTNPPPAFLGFDITLTFFIMAIPLALGGLRRKIRR